MKRFECYKNAYSANILLLYFCINLLFVKHIRYFDIGGKMNNDWTEIMETLKKKRKKKAMFNDESHRISHWPYQKYQWNTSVERAS